MFIDVTEPDATFTNRTVWRFNVIVSYGRSTPKLEPVAKLVQARKSRRHKWIDDPSRGFYPDDWRNRGKRPPQAPIDIALEAAEQFAQALREAVVDQYDVAIAQERLAEIEAHPERVVRPPPD